MQKREVVLTIPLKERTEFISFVERELRHQGANRFASEVVLEEARGAFPPSGGDRLKLEPETIKVVATLLSSGGVIAFFSVLKEWLRERRSRLDVLDRSKGIRISFEGSLNEKNRALLDKLIGDAKDSSSDVPNTEDG